VIDDDSIDLGRDIATKLEYSYPVITIAALVSQAGVGA
jgi:hypothetical protein